MKGIHNTIQFKTNPRAAALNDFGSYRNEKSLYLFPCNR